MVRDFKFFAGPTYPTSIDPNTIPIPDGYSEYRASFFRDGWLCHFSGDPIYSCPYRSDLNRSIWEYGWTEARHYRGRLLGEITNQEEYQ